MRLKRVWISDYKNLKDFTFEFKEDNFLEIFVGKNASGKSNLFEAIALIFKHLSEFRQGESTPIEFDYEIEYLLNDQRILFQQKITEGFKLTINDTLSSPPNDDLKPYLPENILIYYSGHNHVFDYINQTYQENFIQWYQLMIMDLPEVSIEDLHETVSKEDIINFQDNIIDQSINELKNRLGDDWELLQESETPDYIHAKQSILRDYLQDNFQSHMIKIDDAYRDILLLIYCIKNDQDEQSFLNTKLNISSIYPEIRLNLTRPFYARKLDIEEYYSLTPQTKDDITPLIIDRYRIDRMDEKTRYWSVGGQLDTVLSHFENTHFPDSKQRSIGYFPNEIPETPLPLKDNESLLNYPLNDEWHIYSYLPQLKDNLNSVTAFDLFQFFNMLKILGMFKSITLKFTSKNSDDRQSLSQLSDGQLQSLYIFALTEIFKDQQTLMLLDEPDSFLHPEWQYQFLDQIREISDEAQQGNHILMSSHSAITMINHPQKRINYIDLNDNKVNCYPLPKRIAIERLSSEMIHYAEEEQLLLIINSIQIENKAVLFVEGITDPYILKEAWIRLYPEEKMPFIPMFAFGHLFIPRLLNDENICKEIGKNGLFALFDFDEAYDSWNGLKKDSDSIFESNPYRGLGININRHGKKAYAFMMPLPKNEALKGQIFDSTGEHFKNQTLCEIEHLFYGEKMQHLFEEKEMPGGGKSIHFKGDKVQFAKEIIPTLDKSSFEIFRPMFEFIKSKCGNRDI